MLIKDNIQLHYSYSMPVSRGSATIYEAGGCAEKSQIPKGAKNITFVEEGDVLGCNADGTMKQVHRDNGRQTLSHIPYEWEKA